MAEYPEINVPMSDEDKKKVKATDLSWTGPKLIGLLLGTLAVAFTVLWLAANQKIGPTFHQSPPAQTDSH